MDAATRLATMLVYTVIQKDFSDFKIISGKIDLDERADGTGYVLNKADGKVH